MTRNHDPMSHGDEYMDDRLRRLRTRSVQGGHDGVEGEIWPVVPPIVQATACATHDPDAIARRAADTPSGPIYNREHFPNVRMLEELVATLEGAESGYATSSGMAAISLVALSLLSQGSHLVMGVDGYSDSENLLSRELSRFGIGCSCVDIRDFDAVAAAMRPETGMIFAETIANPGMVVADLPRLADLAHAHDVPLVIDNTFATPVLCQPIAHGADLVIHSATKFLGGHHDLSAGVVVGDERRMARLRDVGYLLGAVPGAHDAWLAVRGIRTLVPRMTWISQSACEVAAFFTTRPEISAVRYPGLATGAEGELVARMLPEGYGGVIVVAFAGTDPEGTVADFIRALRMIPYVPSLGGEITTVCHPPHMADAGGDGRRFTAGALRLSVGLEDPADIIADLEQAFAAINV